jgi:O-antigen ligase
MLKLSFQAFRASPLLGQGLGLVLDVTTGRGEIRPARDPHNGLAWLASKMGLLGLAFMAWVLGALGLALWRRRRGGPLTATAAAALAMVLAMEAFEAGLLRFTLIMSLMLLLLALREAEGA